MGKGQRASAAARGFTSCRGLPVPGRSVITTKLGIVATSQPLASSAGVQILERGGNAIDAAIAANATLGLTEPMMNGIGGDLFAIIYEAKTGKLYGLNASGWAATGMTADFLAAKAVNGRMPQRGVMTVNVPGAVAGWAAMQKKFGKLGFEQTLAPAIYYAEHGFPIGEITAGLWAPVMTANYTNDHFKSTFLPGGHSPKAVRRRHGDGGDHRCRPDLRRLRLHARLPDREVHA